MQAVAYEGYFRNGCFYMAGKNVPLPEKRRVVITIFEDLSDIEDDGNTSVVQNSERPFDFVTEIPPLPDSFFDPLPEEELALWEK